MRRRSVLDIRRSFFSTATETVLYNGFKNFNDVDINFILIDHMIQRCIEVIAFEPNYSVEAPRIYINSELLKSKFPVATTSTETFSEMKEIIARQRQVAQIVQFILSRLSIDPYEKKNDFFVKLIAKEGDVIESTTETKIDIECEKPEYIMPFETSREAVIKVDRFAILTQELTSSLHNVADDEADAKHNEINLILDNLEKTPAPTPTIVKKVVAEPAVEEYRYKPIFAFPLPHTNLKARKRWQQATKRVLFKVTMRKILIQLQNILKRQLEAMRKPPTPRAPSPPRKPEPTLAEVFEMEIQRTNANIEHVEGLAKRAEQLEVLAFDSIVSFENLLDHNEMQARIDAIMAEMDRWSLLEKKFEKKAYNPLSNCSAKHRSPRHMSSKSVAALPANSKDTSDLLSGPAADSVRRNSRASAANATKRRATIDSLKPSSRSSSPQQQHGPIGRSVSHASDEQEDSRPRHSAMRSHRLLAGQQEEPSAASSSMYSIRTNESIYSIDHEFSIGEHSKTDNDGLEEVEGAGSFTVKMWNGRPLLPSISTAGERRLYDESISSSSKLTPIHESRGIVPVNRLGSMDLDSASRSRRMSSSSAYSLAAERRRHSESGAGTPTSFSSRTSTRAGTPDQWKTMNRRLHPRVDSPTAAGGDCSTPPLFEHSTSKHSTPGSGGKLQPIDKASPNAPVNMVAASPATGNILRPHSALPRNKSPSRAVQVHSAYDEDHTTRTPGVESHESSGSNLSYNYSSESASNTPMNSRPATAPSHRQHFTPFHIGTGGDSRDSSLHKKYDVVSEVSKLYRIDSESEMKLPRYAQRTLCNKIQVAASHSEPNAAAPATHGTANKKK